MHGLYVRLSVGAEQYAIPVTQAVEVLIAPVAEVPGSASAIRGVCNLRGELLPVFDLAGLIGIVRGDAEHVLVVEHAGNRAGLLVGAVSDVEALPEVTPEASGFVDGTVLVDGQIIGVLSVPRTFDAMTRAATDG